MSALEAYEGETGEVPGTVALDNYMNYKLFYDVYTKYTYADVIQLEQ